MREGRVLLTQWTRRLGRLVRLRRLGILLFHHGNRPSILPSIDGLRAIKNLSKCNERLKCTRFGTWIL